MDEISKNCCSSSSEQNKNNLEQHWDNVYTKSSQEKLGWFETDLNPTLHLINKTNLARNARILNVGAGSTTLVDELLSLGSQIIATDISAVALTNLENRIGKGSVEIIVDDLTNPHQLTNIEPVDLWIDRAVLHFFTEKNDQDTYFELLQQKVAKKGYVILAEFSLDSASKCSGLPVYRYSKEMLSDKLGSNFSFTENFEYNYTMPSGALRPYIYTLFRRGL